MPAGWCVMEVDTADRVHLKTIPTVTPITVDARLDVVLQIAMRHYNRHAYRMMRDLGKKRRIEVNKSESRVRWLETFRCLVVIGKGGRDGIYTYKNVDDVLKSRQIGKLTSDIKRELQELWGKLRD